MYSGGCTTLATRAGSSAGQSSGLIIRRSEVRVLPGPSRIPLSQGLCAFGGFLSVETCPECVPRGCAFLPVDRLGEPLSGVVLRDVMRVAHRRLNVGVAHERLNVNEGE